jgi:hypothetical protein
MLKDHCLYTENTSFLSLTQLLRQRVAFNECVQKLQM